MDINIKIFPPYGAFGEICYLAAKGGSAFMVDAPGNFSAVEKFLGENDLTLKKILLTHGHTDHIAGLAEAAEKSGAEVYISADDAPLLHDNYMNLTEYFGISGFREYTGAVTEVNEGDMIDFEGSEIKVISVPGHTKGSVLYVTEDIIFSGDTLFQSSAGRTDMPGGNERELMNSLRKIAKLFGGGSFTVLSGHTPPTTVKEELMYNPYLSAIGDL